MATNPRLADIILAAFLARRNLLLEGGAPAIRVIGSRYSPESSRVREFLVRTRIPHEWIDSDSDFQVEALLQHFSIDSSELPVVIATGLVLRNPSPAALGSFLGLTVESLPERCFDLIVVGCGPAGARSAISSRGLEPICRPAANRTGKTTHIRDMP